MPTLTLRSKVHVGLLLVLLPALALLLRSAERSRDVALRDILREQAILASAVATGMASIVDRANEAALAVAGDPLVVSLDTPSLDSHLLYYTGRYLQFEGVNVYDARGRNRGWGTRTMPAEPRADIAAERAFQLIMHERAPLAIGTRQSPQGKTRLAFYAPLFSWRGGFAEGNDLTAPVGVVELLVDTDEITTLMRALDTRKDQAFRILNAKAGLSLLAEGKDGFVLRPSTFPPPDATESGEGETRVVRKDFEFRGDEGRGRGALVGLAKGWYVGAMLPVSTFTHAYSEDLARNVLLAIVTAALCYSIGSLFARRLVGPMESLSELARRLKEGDLSARIHWSRKDEIGVLGAALDDMADTIERRSRQRTVLDALQTALAGTADEAELLRRVVAQGATLADWCSVEKALPEGRLAREACAASPAPAAEPGEVADCVDIPNFDGTDSFGPAMVLLHHVERWCGPMPLDGNWRLVTFALATPERPIGRALTLGFGPDRPFRSEDVGFLRDFADRCAMFLGNASLLEEARRLNRTKDEFIATISHELRTPMSVILGWLRFLHVGSVPSDRHAKIIATLLRNAEVQARMVEDVVDVANGMTGNLRLNLAELDLSRIVTGAVESLSLAARGKGIEFCYRIEEGLSSIEGDSARLHQVFWNLLSNAIKFSRAEGVVRISLTRDGEGNGLLFGCADDGVGIDPHFLPFVFEPFRQQDGTATRRFGGLGLGLAITKHIVDAHGASIHVWSAGTGQGTTVTLRFPVPLHRVQGASSATSRERGAP